MEEQVTKGYVSEAYGNLLKVRFEGSVRQGEIAFVNVGELWLKAEVIEVISDHVKIQVFEDTAGVAQGSLVTFSGHLLEAELGPGLLGTIFDGLQNRLEVLARDKGVFLQRGCYVSPIDDQRDFWEYEPKVEVGNVLVRGDLLGLTKEGSFNHRIMVPFSCFSTITVTWVIAPGRYSADTVVAKGRDDSGKEYSFTMIQKWPVKFPLREGKEIPCKEMMVSGLRILDTQVPILKGGTFCTPGPFGAGKTVLQHHLSRYASVDIVVLCACGERAGEVVEVLKEFPHLIDPDNGKPLIHRTCIICNTSSMPVAARESSVYMAATIAEYYRQMGLNVLLLADSTSRWAQAMREISGRLEEIPGEEAFPAYLSSRISSFYERSGVIALKDGKEGSLTICGSVSPAGGNFEEPVTQSTLVVVGAFCGLSKERASARRYPSIDPLISWSKYMDRASDLFESQMPSWGKTVLKANALLRQGDEIAKRMEVIGEEGISQEEMEIYLKAELYDFCYLQQNAFDPVDSYCPIERQLALFRLMADIFETRFNFENTDEARRFFLELQSKIKTLNGFAFDSDNYEKLHAEIGLKITEKLVGTV